MSVDLGQGKLEKFLKNIDPTRPLEYDSAASITTDNQITTKSYVDSAVTGFVGFRGRVTSPIANVTGDGTIWTATFSTEDFDVGSNFNPATGVFTAPQTGYYTFIFNMIMSQVATADHTAITAVITAGGVGNPFDNEPVTFDGSHEESGSVHVRLTSAQTAFCTVQVAGTALTVDGGVGMTFAGWLVGV